VTQETKESMEQELATNPLTSASVSRRRFLAGTTAAAAVAVVAAACGKDDKKDTSAGQTSDTTAAGATATTAAAGANADLDVAAAAAGLEMLATKTYKAAGDKYGTVAPPAVVTFVTSAAKQHQEALDNWNKVLTGAGRQAVTAPTAALAQVVDGAFAKLTGAAAEVPAVATLALRLEDYASQTYQKVLPTLKSPDAIKLAAQINVVGVQHQAILRYVLGLYPVGSGPTKASTGLANVDFAPSDPQPTLITG